MSQTKAQLVNPLDGDVGNKIVVGSAVTVTVDGISASVGVITASSFSGSGAGLSGVGTANVSTTSLVVTGVSTIGAAVTIADYGIHATGVVTATSFVGDITGDVTGNVSGTSGGLTGAPNITVTNLTVNGTETIINTNELNVRDKTVGIGSTTTPTSTTQDGAGIIIYGQTQVDFLYDNDKAAIGLNTALSVTGFVTAASFSGDGSALTGVISGIDIQSSGSLTGTAITALNFSGATITADDSVGISTITISAPGVSTAAQNPAASYATVYLDLANAQHHDIYLSAGITTFSCTGGNIGESHSVMVQQPSSGITTVGYSTAFLWAGGSQANFSYPAANSEIELFTFVVKQAGAAGTVLLASASAGAYS